jgi:hypothetical protein
MLELISFEISLSESFCHAPSERDVTDLLIYVVLDCNQLVAWSVVSGGM